MKGKHLLIAILSLCFFAPTLHAQKGTAAPEITVFESVLSTASWANFKYQDQLGKAKAGDHKAMMQLLEFSGTVDGRAALDHSVTLLELLGAGTDLTFAGALHMEKPNLKKILLDRLQLAQSRTQKENLRKPIAEWAPNTWEVLHGKPYAPKNGGDLSMDPTGAKTRAKEKAAAGKQGANSIQGASPAVVPKSDRQ
jgi:hypothetical protein